MKIYFKKLKKQKVTVNKPIEEIKEMLKNIWLTQIKKKQKNKKYEGTNGKQIARWLAIHSSFYNNQMSINKEWD